MARAGRASAALAIAACVALAAMLLAAAGLGFGRYVITSGSMAGAFDRGSLLFAKPVPVSDLRVGDVIVYEPPPGAGPGGLVSHRIVWTGRDPDGLRAFRTKGDANKVPDPWRFTLRSRTQARASFDVPYVGYALAALGVRELRMLLIGLPALLIGLAVAASLWREPEPVPAEATA